MSAQGNNSTAIDLYLNLLQKSLTSTLFDDEPDHDNTDGRAFVSQFAKHYIRGSAITMLPRVRLDNIRQCTEYVLQNNIPGDFLEAGVWRGGGCIFMSGCLRAFEIFNRRVWVADSFEGLPEPDATRTKEVEFHNSPLMQKIYGKMSASLQEVQANFSAYGMLDNRVQFLRGWFKDTLPGAQFDRLALMRLDGDYYESTIDALGALYPRLSPGGIVIIDDYGEDLWTDCRQAVEDFRSANDIGAELFRVDSKCVFWKKPL